MLRLLPSAGATLTATCGMLALACALLCQPGSCGWFGLSQDEMLTKLRADGGQLSSEKVYDILRAAKDTNGQVDSFSVKELRSLNELSLDQCTSEELDRRRAIATRPLTDETNGNVRRYARDLYGHFVIFCARNADKLLRRHIIEIGAQTKQNLSYFKSGVHANERDGLELGKAMADYLARGMYVDAQYKKTIATGCKTVNKHLRHIVTVQDHAEQLGQSLNLNHSLQDWMRLNEYCKLYNSKFVDK